MALGREIVDFIRLHFLDDADQVRGVGEVAIVEDEVPVLGVGILVQMIDAVGIER